MSTYKPYVLLVDDDADTHFLHSRLIRKRFPHARVASVSDGRQALRFLMNATEGADECPTHLWLDLNMPTMDGWDFLEALTANSKKITCRPTITIVSSSPDPEHMQKATTFGVQKFVQKFMGAQEVDNLLTVH